MGERESLERPRHGVLRVLFAILISVPTSFALFFCVFILISDSRFFWGLGVPGTLVYAAVIYYLVLATTSSSVAGPIPGRMTARLEAKSLSITADLQGQLKSSGLDRYLDGYIDRYFLKGQTANTKAMLMEVFRRKGVDLTGVRLDALCRWRITDRNYERYLAALQGAAQRSEAIERHCAHFGPDALAEESILFLRKFLTTLEGESLPPDMELREKVTDQLQEQRERARRQAAEERLNAFEQSLLKEQEAARPGAKKEQ